MRKKIIVLLLVLLLVSLGGVVLYERSLMKRYNETKMRITVEQLEKSWGAPTYDFIYMKTQRILIYETILGYTQYNFKFDAHSGLLIDKFAEDKSLKNNRY